MRRIRLAVGIVLAVGILTTGTVAQAPLLELGSCHDDLDQLQKDASDASDTARDAQSESDDYQDCIRDPQTYDLLGDGCRSHRSDYESALSDLESKMDDLDSRLHSVQTSCGYEFTVNRMSALEATQRHLEASRNRLCASFKGFIRFGLAPDNVLKMCIAESHQGEEWCKACLGLK